MGKTNNPEQFRQLIAQAVQRHGLPPEWADIGFRQLQAESGGNAQAVSPKGAQGLMQFMPKTAKAYGLENPNDPAQSIDAWARMTKDLIGQTGGNPAHVLAAYNWGIGNLNKQGMAKAPAETQQYLQKILGGMPSAGTSLAQAEAPPAYAPPAQKMSRQTAAVDGLGAGDYHRAIEDGNRPKAPALDERMAGPAFDAANYSPDAAALRAYGPESLAAYGPSTGVA